MSIQAADVRIECDAVEVSQFEIAGTVPGLVVTGAAGRNGPGTGRLQVAAGQAQWRAPGSLNFGPGVDVTVSGTYCLCDGDDADKWVRVLVNADFLPAAAVSAPVYLADRYETAYVADPELAWNQIAGRDVTAAEALAGDEEQWSFEVANRHPSETILGLVVWIDPAVTWIELSVNGGHDWYAPTTEATALLLGDLGPDTTKTVMVRRTVPALTPSDPAKLVLFHFAWNTFF